MPRLPGFERSARAKPGKTLRKPLANSNASAGVHFDACDDLPGLVSTRVDRRAWRPPRRPIRLVLPGNRCNPLSGQIAEIERSSPPLPPERAPGSLPPVGRMSPGSIQKGVWPAGRPDRAESQRPRPPGPPHRTLPRSRQPVTLPRFLMATPVKRPGSCATWA